MTSEVEISRAEISDLDGAEALYDEVCGYLADKPYNPGWRKGCFPTRENARYFIENEAMYVARIDGEIVGSVSLTYNPSADIDQQSGDNEASREIFSISIYLRFIRTGTAAESAPNYLNLPMHTPGRRM